MTDGPHCFIEKLGTSAEQYREMRQVPDEKLAATEFVELADLEEAKVDAGRKIKETMTAHYLLNFADIWRKKLPRNSHRDYAE